MPAAAALRAGLGRPVVILPTAAEVARRGPGGGWAEGRRTADYLDSIRLFACLLHALPAAEAGGAGGAGAGSGSD